MIGQGWLKAYVVAALLAPAIAAAADLQIYFIDVAGVSPPSS